jgi:hypothetical protein
MQRPRPARTGDRPAQVPRCAGVSRPEGARMPGNISTLSPSIRRSRPSVFSHTRSFTSPGDVRPSAMPPRCRIGASPYESRLSLSEKNHPTHMVHCAWLTTMSMTSSGLTPASFTASSGRRIMPAQGCSARHLRVRSSWLGFTRNSRSQHNRSSIASFPARLDSSRDTADDRSPTDPFERTRTLGRTDLRRRQGPRIDCSHIPQRRPRSRRMTTTMRRTSTTPPAGVSLPAVRPSRARSKHCSLLPFCIQQKIFPQPPLPRSHALMMRPSPKQRSSLWNRGATLPEPQSQ